MKPSRAGWRLCPPIVIVKYWLLQGILHMNSVERLHRWTLEFLFFMGVYPISKAFSSYPADLIISMLSAHTLNFIFNGHVFAMCLHDLFWFGFYKDEHKFFRYVDKIKERLELKSPRYLTGVVFFGSLSRGIFRETSDLDIRYVAEDGFWNAFRCAHLVFIERLHALLKGFPIDVYMYRSGAEILKKMDVRNEHPVSIYNCGERLERILPENIPFAIFRKKWFKETYDDTT